MSEKTKEKLIDLTLDLIKAQGKSKNPLDRILSSSEIAKELNISVRKARSLLESLMKWKKINRIKKEAQFYYYLRNIK